MASVLAGRLGIAGLAVLLASPAIAQDGSAAHDGQQLFQARCASASPSG